jgi:hypothetical protein
MLCGTRNHRRDGVYINATPRTCPNGEGEGATSFTRIFFLYLETLHLNRKLFGSSRDRTQCISHFGASCGSRVLISGTESGFCEKCRCLSFFGRAEKKIVSGVVLSTSLPPVYAHGRQKNMESEYLRFGESEITKLLQAFQKSSNMSVIHFGSLGKHEFSS